MLEVIENEHRIEAIDYEPTNEMVFWADSYEKSIKRSYMVNAVDGKVKIGYAQDLNVKGTYIDNCSILRLPMRFVFEN